MPLLTGNWSIVVEGYEGTLDISSVSSSGSVSFTVTIAGLLLGTDPGTNEFQVGYWDESSQTITLHVTKLYQGGPQLNHAYLFEGYQFPTPAQPAPRQDVVWTLVGQVTILGEGPNEMFFLSPNARRHRFGWRATQRDFR